MLLYLGDEVNMTKDTVIEILKTEQGYVSGERISQELGISRAAVNSAVKSLREKGYEIESTTNKGYKLISCPDVISLGELNMFLSKERTQKILCFDKITSTNDVLREMAQKGAGQGQVAIAEEQTIGKGRENRKFYSPRSCGIYMSMILQPKGSVLETISITAWIAVAVSRAIENVCKIKTGIKWVNDLVLNKKKICGISTELSLVGESAKIQYIITGIGINVNQDSMPDEIKDVATSIRKESGIRYSRAELVAEVIKQLDRLCEEWGEKKEEYLKEYRDRNVTLHNQLRVIRGNDQKTSYAEEIDEDFGLVVSFPDGTKETVRSGEVKVRGLYGYV